MWGQRGRTVKDHHANITPAPPNPSLDGLPRVRAIKTNYDTTNEAMATPSRPTGFLPFLRHSGRASQGYVSRCIPPLVCCPTRAADRRPAAVERGGRGALKTT